jgi:hypothetical protein
MRSSFSTRRRHPIQFWLTVTLVLPGRLLLVLGVLGLILALLTCPWVPLKFVNDTPYTIALPVISILNFGCDVRSRV